MSALTYDQLKQQLMQIVATIPSAGTTQADTVRYIATSIGADPETMERLVLDLCSPAVSGVSVSPPQAVVAVAPLVQDSSEAAPYLLIRLGEDLRPGAHLAPEFHLLHSRFDGDVQVEATIHGALDQQGWSPKPRLTDESPGYWIFHQSLRLTVGGVACPLGEYRLEFECQFRGSALLPDSTWRGWMHFRVIDQGAMGQALEVVADGQGLINLHGVDLRRFNRIRFESRENSLINLQSFLEELEKEASARPADASQPSMIPVKLRPVADRFGVRAIALPNTRARLDLPDGKRILLFAQNSVILGRNRPGSADSDNTDIALRMYPRSEIHDSLTRNISRQQLSMTVHKGQIKLDDPRRPESRQQFAARVNGRSFSTPVTIPHSPRTIAYTALLGEPLASTDNPPQLGLSIRSWDESNFARGVYPRLQQLQRDHADREPWFRDTAGLDAVLIQRSNNPDELDGKEAYLLVLGIVLIGSDPRCPLRVNGPNVRPLHAILCHWDGQFRVLPIEDAFVSCQNRSIPRGACGTLFQGDDLRIGDVTLKLDLPQQFGLE